MISIEANKQKELLEKYKTDIPDNWSEKNKNERRKYLELYSEGHNYKKTRDERGYGRGNHGSGIVEYLKSKNVQSILDVGCGYGNFCKEVADFIPKVYGADIASVKTGNTNGDNRINFIDSDALHLDMPDNAVDYVVSFDCLEHCLEEDIEPIIQNLSRIAKKGMIFSITYRQAGERSEHGEFLHMTVQPETWWINKIEKFAKLVHKEGSASHAGIVEAQGSKYLCFEIEA